MNRPVAMVYLIVALVCVVLAFALTDAGQTQPGQPQPANPAWPDAVQPG